MFYWIIMFILAAGCILMLSVSFAGMKKNSAAGVSRGRRGRGGYDEDEEDEYDEPPRRRQQAAAAPAQDRRARKQKLRWKILMEDIDSWEKYSFTF